MILYQVVITKPAEMDLREIAHYIKNELRDPSAAKQLIARIGEAIVGLEEMPFRHVLVIDRNLAKQGIRKLMVNNYIVFYIASEEDKTVTVLRIIYGRREWNSLLT